jgi:hypothetical protein
MNDGTNTLQHLCSCNYTCRITKLERRLSALRCRIYLLLILTLALSIAITLSLARM